MLQESAKTALLTKPALTATTFSLKKKKKNADCSAKIEFSLFVWNFKAEHNSEHGGKK